MLWARARLAKQFRLLLDNLELRLELAAWQTVRARLSVALDIGTKDTPTQRGNA
jgi:hypothetical protein